MRIGFIYQREKRSVKRNAMLILTYILLMQPFSAAASVTAAENSLGTERSGPGIAKWVQAGDRWWYRYEDGAYPQSQWEELGDKWYYFDAEGYMMTGLLMMDEVYYYLSDEDGSMVTGESRIVDGQTYHFDDTGTGTLEWPYKRPLAVPPESEKSEFHKKVDAMADSVLAEIINDDMSQREKSTAIFWWIKNTMTYSGFSPTGDWVSGAYDGLRMHRGDCYTYYSLSAELLNRAGFQTIEVIRSRDNDHYWNLVNVDGDWYHFDPCPTVTDGNVLLLRDSQLLPNRSHEFDHSLYPPTL